MSTGIDVSNDKDTSSVRSSPDAGSLPIRPAMVTSQHGHFPNVLPSPQHDSSKTPTTNRAAVTPLSSAPPAGMKLDFNFDPKLAEQSGNVSAAAVDLPSSVSASQNRMSQKVGWQYICLSVNM